MALSLKQKASIAILLPAVVVLSGTLAATIAVYYNRVALEKIHARRTKEQLQCQAKEHAATLDEFLCRIESVVATVGEEARELWNDRHPSYRPNCFHNPKITSPPTDMAYSAKHQRNISFSRSMFKVAPLAYERPDEYIRMPEKDTYRQWPEQVQESINISADLDLIFIPTYASMEEIMWVYMGTEQGVHRAYPYHGPIEKSYDPRERPWYLAAINSDPDQVIFTTPFVDAGTGQVIVTAALQVQDESGKRIGVVGVDFQFETVCQKVLAMDTAKSGRTFLLSRDFYIMVHPDYQLPKKTWKETDLRVPVEKYETSGEKFKSLLKMAARGKATQALVDYGVRGKQMVSLVPLEKTGLIMGQAVPYSQITVGHTAVFYKKRIMLLAAFDAIAAVLLLLALKDRNMHSTGE